MENINEQLNPISPALPKTPEQIEQEMQQTRESMTAKVSVLENQVVGSVQTAADTLTGTVDAVQSLMNAAPAAVSDTMQHAAAAVSDKMKEMFDVSGHVQKNPWTAVSVSAGVGFIVGLLLFRDKATALPPAPAAAPAPSAAPAAASTAPGLFNDLLGMLGQKVKRLAETALDSAAAAANQKVEETIPKLMDTATEATHSLRFNGVANRA
ncbi:MAG: DUF883 C-terminal domain-containing protein [Planctomycetes bacterium]|nr:DUF883 C-terminal domain-containing protein [Planctomycetota bacterium]